MTEHAPPEGEPRAVRFETADGVAWITLNRPAAANARNQRMRAELAGLYREVAVSTEVRVVVLTGAGDRHFCAGMDLKEAGRPETVLERRQRMRASRDIEMLARLPQPTIAAVNGHALGGGCEMALACDIRVVADEARMGLPEVTHGLMPGGGGTVRLPRLIGLERALEMLYLGTVLDGPAVVAAGLASRHVPRAQLRATVSELAAAIAQRPAHALRAVKESVLAGLDQPQAALDRELDGLLFLMAQRQDEA